MTAHPPFDAITLFHYMWFKNRCYEADGTAFQRLFEDVMVRAEPSFTRVRPYGSLGDRKCDGLLMGAGTVYQVYSPDSIKQADTLKKIEEDLSGALLEWRDLKKWVFVYNVRTGLPPDVPRLLLDLRAQYPDIVLTSISNDQLWEITRSLTVQQRSEVLAPPPSGFEQIYLMPSAPTEEIEERLRDGRFVLIQDVMSPINVHRAADAMNPERPFGAPLILRPALEDGWEEAARYQMAVVDDAIQRGRDLMPKFAVFSLSPIPLALHLGFLLSDRVEVRLFQYDRDRSSWTWDATCLSGDVGFAVTGIPAEAAPEITDVVMRVSLSAVVSSAQVEQTVGSAYPDIHIRVAEPSVYWLCHPDQLVALGRQVRVTLQRIVEQFPSCRMIHLFYAGPTGGAITIGRAVNPRMTPPVLTYEFQRQAQPPYEPAILLT